MNHQRNQAAIERREQVAALRLAGVRNQLELARRFGVNHSTISRDFAWLDRLWRERAGESIEAAKGQDLERCDALILGYWAAAIKGDEKSARLVLDVLRHRAKILGLELQRHELSGPDGGVLTFTIALGEPEREDWTESYLPTRAALPAAG